MHVSADTHAFPRNSHRNSIIIIFLSRIRAMTRDDRRSNNRWPWSASATGCRDPAACVPAGAVWAQRDRQRPEVACFADTPPRRRSEPDPAVDYHPSITTTICFTPPRVRIIVCRTRREAVSERSAGQMLFSTTFSNYYAYYRVIEYDIEKPVPLTRLGETRKTIWLRFNWRREETVILPCKTISG